MIKHLQKFLRALLLSLSVLLSLPVLPVEVEIDGINYDLFSKGKIATVIAKKDNYYGEVVIPETVEHEGATYGVKAIADRAFYGCGRLTSVTIPKSLTSIGAEAFYVLYGTTLKSVYISDLAAWCSIKFKSYNSNPLCYASYLFLNGEKVKDLVIPNSVTSIEGYAFYGCDRLTSVTIPKSVTSIGYCAFYGCTALSSVTIENASIGKSAFDYCTSLSSVTIENGSIGESAFSSCTALTSITIGDGVTRIGSNAFSGCDNLTSVHISDIAAWCNIEFYESTTSNPLCYASRLFLNGEEVKNLIIPNSVTRIAYCAFENFSGLTSVTIENGVKSIEACAFSGCTGLTSVIIPNSVTSIEGCTFLYCTALTSLTIGNGVTSIGELAFSGCTGLSSVTIPNSVTRIDYCAFSGCTGLISATIGNSVTSIAQWAFNNCKELLDVYCHAEKVPSAHSYAFQGSFPEYINLHVPAASLESYKTTAPWNQFGNIVALTDEETGIDELKSTSGTAEPVFFDLNGRKVQKQQKGIYIQNGRKILVK